MADKEYRFVPKKGLAVATSDLFVRKGQPSRRAEILKEVRAGTVLPYIGFVLDGETVGGISKWLFTAEGDFFWAGTVSTEAEPQVDARCLHKPLDTLICTQRFGERPSFYAPLGSPKGHNGVDFRTKQNNGSWKIPVYAVLDGTVVEATENKWNGKFVRINHSNGHQSVYLHLDEIKVKKDDSVKAGTKISTSGNSGSASEAPHLHFGYRSIKFDKDNGYMGYIDPISLFLDSIQFVS